MTINRDIPYLFIIKNKERKTCNLRKRFYNIKYYVIKKFRRVKEFLKEQNTNLN